MDPIAVLSDIHGNVWALEAMLEDAQERGIRRFINLGDALYGPLEPRKTYDLLKIYKVHSISGNQDRIIYESSKQEVNGNETLKYVVESLDEEQITWAKSLSKTALIENRIFLCHGTPSDDQKYLLEDISEGWPRVREEKKITEMLGGNDYPVILCGHSHIPRLVQLSSGQIIVNPGSVGLQAYTDGYPVKHLMENHSPQVSYVILRENDGNLKVEFIRIPYDHQSATQRAAGLEREDWAYSLMTGRAM